MGPFGIESIQQPIGVTPVKPITIQATQKAEAAAAFSAEWEKEKRKIEERLKSKGRRCSAR